MNFMQFPSSTMHSSAGHINRTYRPVWLTSNSYEIPNYTLLDTNSSKRIALILYYAHIMDHKKLLKDFFKLCKDNFENQCETKGLESDLKAWIKQSIFKLQRRREQIISNVVTTYQSDMLRTIYQVLLSIFCDIARESRSNMNLNVLSKKSYSSPIVNNEKISTSFHRRQLLSPSNSSFKDFRSSISEWDTLLLSQQFQQNKGKVMSVSSLSTEWLQKFWMKFCYQPDPTAPMMSHTTSLSLNSDQNSENCSPTEVTQNGSFNQSHTIRKCLSSSTNELTSSIQNRFPITISKFNTMLSSSNSATGLNPTNQNSVPNLNQTNQDGLSINSAADHEQNQTKDLDGKCHSCDDSSSVSTSDSSDSWSCADFVDETSEDEYLSSISMSHGISLDKCNSTLLWLQSTRDLSSDEESVIFEGVITEENCLEFGETKGSLYFIDTDDDFDDLDVMFSSESSKNASCIEDDYEDKSQGYDNPSFEEEFKSFCMPKFIRTVNECWSEMMLDLEKKPRQASKVSFAPDASLVTIHCFERTEENSYDHAVVTDNIRFQRRVRDLNYLLSPYFTCEYREDVQKRNDLYQVDCS